MTDQEQDTEDRHTPERRCVVTGEVRPVAELIRFVVGPDGDIVPDLAEDLPGRGLWVTADQKILTRAADGKAFSRAARRPVRVQPDLVNHVETLLMRRMGAHLGLARKAGVALLGFDIILKSFDSRVPPRLLVEAIEGAGDGRRKLQQAARARGLKIETVECLSTSELGLALGRENVIHAAVKPGALADRLRTDGTKLARLRAAPVNGTAGIRPVWNERNA